jgi:formyltetrahydrofolate deformylase
MHSHSHTYTLTLSCRDTLGIVAAVSGFLSEHGCFILESGQFGDLSTERFFMRTQFTLTRDGMSEATLLQAFYPIAERFAMEWQLRDSRVKPRLLLMVSKASHCLNDLLHRYASGTLQVTIPAVISNHEELRGLTEWYGIPYHYLPVTPDTKRTQEEAIAQLVEREQIDLVVLARYMQILSPFLVGKLAGKAINIHHSFLPSFKGAKPYHQAFDRGVKLIGATAHYVSDDLDEGPIIEQEVMHVDHAYTPQALEAAGRDIESRVLARAVRYHTENRVLVNAHKTVVFR